MTGGAAGLLGLHLTQKFQTPPSDVRIGIKTGVGADGFCGYLLVKAPPPVQMAYCETLIYGERSLPQPKVNSLSEASRGRNGTDCLP